MINTRAHILLSACALTLLAACSSDKTIVATDPTPTSIIAGSVTAKRSSSGILLANGTERAVGYAVWNPSYLGLFTPCSDPAPTCLRLKQGESVTVPFSDIVGGGTSSTEVVVYWWHVLPDGAGVYQAGVVGRISIKD